MSATRRKASSSGHFIAMVASLGGMAAVSYVLGGLLETFSVPILLLQHGVAGIGEDQRVALWQRRSRLPIRSAVAGSRSGVPGLTVVPPGRGATVASDGRVQLHDSVPDGGGGDAMLKSVAEHYGRGAIAVVLTGNLSDGTKGVQAVKRNGGRVLVEDPQQARASGMPSSAIATGCVDFVVPIERMASALVALTLAPGGEELLAVRLPSWAQLGS